MCITIYACMKVCSKVNKTLKINEFLSFKRKKNPQVELKSRGSLILFYFSRVELKTLTDPSC